MPSRQALAGIIAGVVHRAASKSGMGGIFEADTRLIVAGPIWPRSQTNQAKAIALLVFGPVQPSLCIIGKRRRKT